jgi:hypothetical protein
MGASLLSSIVKAGRAAAARSDKKEMEARDERHTFA